MVALCEAFEYHKYFPLQTKLHMVFLTHWKSFVFKMLYQIQIPFLLGYTFTLTIIYWYLKYFFVGRFGTVLCLSPYCLHLLLMTHIFFIFFFLHSYIYWFYSGLNAHKRVKKKVVQSPTNTTSLSRLWSRDSH